MLKKILKRLLYSVQFWITGTVLYHHFVRRVLPYIRFNFYYALPTNPSYPQWGALERIGYQHLRPGDIIFTIDKSKLSSKIIGKATAKLGRKVPYFVPSHVALCVKKNKSASDEIVEMTHADFTRSTWEDLTRQSTRVVIARCRDWSLDYIERVVIPTALSFQDRKYDERFQMGEDTLACSELIYFADVAGKLDVSLRPLIGSKPYITPVGLLLGKNVQIIWDSEKEGI
jgi:hypothetical protein